MINIVLFGPPGSGKGTQSDNIMRKFNLTHISTGDLFRKHLDRGTELGKTAQKYMDDGNLVPDEIVINMVDEKLKENNNSSGYIFDGFPRTVPQARALDRLLENLQMPINITIALEVDDVELKNRILERGKTSGRVDDQSKEKVDSRITVYKEETLPVANYYKTQNKFHSINGIGSIDDIAHNIGQVIQEYTLQN
jgi:adenylate kinase